MTTSNRTVRLSDGSEIPQRRDLAEADWVNGAWMRIAILIPCSVFLLAGCSALSVFDGPSRNHVSVANGAAFQVSLAEGEKRLVVALDTQSAMESRVIQTISVGRADAVPVSQYE